MELHEGWVGRLNEIGFNGSLELKWIVPLNAVHGIEGQIVSVLGNFYKE